MTFPKEPTDSLHSKFGSTEHAKSRISETNVVTIEVIFSI
jgi:hypothetical protein